MAHSVTITTPMPTLDELGKDLRLTKAEQNFIIRLVDRKASRRSAAYAIKTLAASPKPAKATTKKASGMVRKKNDRARKIA
jgi:menaquinone-dependent protoporphyrinogen IX oxidase